MFDKDQIIKEIQRVAKETGNKNLKRSDFISRTLIPEKTIDFYIVSWENALVEAGLKEKDDNNNEITDNKLLEDLIRLYNRYGEIPTVSLINDSGKFPADEYRKKWRTLEDAMNIARRKFPDYIEDDDIDMMYEDKNSQSDSQIFNLDDTMVSINREDLILENRETDLSHKKKDKPKFSQGKKADSIDENEELDIKFRTDNVGLESLLEDSLAKKKKKRKTVVPETIKPGIKKSEELRALNFRGVKYIPKKVEGIIFLFGMVCEELSYFIESFPNEDDCFKAKRFTGSDKSVWERVNLGFVVKSSDWNLKNSKGKCDLLVCWEHDWSECPFEILELRSAIKLLENYHPDEKQD